MSFKTGIEWTDHTFNIAWGCMKVSPGCAHCYAEVVADQRHKKGVWGPAATTPRMTMSDRYWKQPLIWNRSAEKFGVRRRVFCSSMADVFEAHPTIDQEREKLWALIRATPHLDWQLLTKRPERIPECLPRDWDNGYPNVWLGTSVESQDYIGRIQHLVTIPAVCHWLSIEPMLGPVKLRGDWEDFLEGWTTEQDHSRGCSPDEGCVPGCPEVHQAQRYPIKWVIVGGESQKDCRPFDLDWARSLRDECKAAGTAFFLKQLGGHPMKRDKRLAILDGCLHKEWPNIEAASV